MHQTSRSYRAHRAALLGGLALAALAAPAAAQERHPIHLPAGPLEASLLKLAAETHEQLLFARELVAGRTAPAVDGQLSTEAALRRLLAGAPIAVERAGPSVLVLRARTSAGTAVPSTVATGGGAAGPRPFGAEPIPDSALATAAGGAPLPPAPPNIVETLEITGTHIRGGVSAAPLLVVSREDLERSGQTTVADALRALPQNFAGGAGEGTVTTGADKLGRNLAFSQGLNLRGLGNNATLVLVDGRRMGGSGAFGDFSDVSSIPTAAVERVEVLLDGASAVYGSDAVGGVVNIILRKDFDGAETRLLAGSGTNRGPAEGRLSQTFGRRWSSGGVVLTYEGQAHDDLADPDRRFAASADLRPLGGSDWRETLSAPGNILKTDLATGALVPGWAIPAGQNGVGLRPSDLAPGVVNLQNQRLREDILPQRTLQTLYLAGDQMIGERLKLKADARYSLRRFRAIQGAGATNLTVTAANPFFVAPDGRTSETIAYSFANDLPNPTQSGSAHSVAGSLGADLQLPADWRSEGYLTYAREIDDIHNDGVVHSLFLREALGATADNPATAFTAGRDGFFNPFSGVPGANNPAVLAFISQGFVFNHTRDEVASASLQADGPLWRLPAGPLKLALGVQARRERFERHGATFVSAVNPIRSAGIDVHRGVEAAFLELQAPLFGPENARPGLQRLELSLAGRVERYEVVGSTEDPKVGVLWEPLEGLALRMTYGTSFRAPALREVDDPPSYSPTLLNLGAGRVRTLLLGGGNPDLKPETATSWTAGVDVRPRRWPGLTLGLTWYDIRFRNRIGQPVLQNLAGALSDPTLSTFVDHISPATNAADRARIAELLATPFVSSLNGVFPPEAYGAIVDNRYVNTARLHVRGVDLTGAYRFDLGPDDVRLGANASYMLAYEQQITPTSPVVAMVGVANFPVRFRGRATADWTHGALSAGAALNYTSAYRDPLGPRIRSQTTLDLQLRLAPADHGLRRDLALTFNVRNVFDRAPPFYDNPAGYGYDPSNGDPIGRFVSVELTRRW